MPLILFFISVLLFTSFSVAQTVLPEIPASTLKSVAKSDKWQALLYYKPHGFFNNIYSEVDDPHFFIAQDGKYNAQSELSATISAFVQEQLEQTINDESRSCQFPERRHFIKQQFPQLNLKDIRCANFDKWREDIKGEVLNLVFPASYINSPSSMFGHTLFRLDGKQGHNLLSSAINFAAFTDPSDDELTFTVKGLTGGYPGYVSLVPYYEKVNEYNHMESRDIWEYKLNLNEQQIQSFIRHIWELDQVRFDYFFIDENCSYRLLTILEAVEPSWNLSESFDSRTVPTDTIRVLEKTGLIGDITFRPSKTTHIEHQRQSLSSDLRILARNLADQPNNSDYQQALNQLPLQQRAQVLELAYHYTRYLVTKKKLASQDIPKRSLKLLSLRAKVDYPQDAFAAVETPQYRDEQGHGTYRYQLGGGYQDLQYQSSQAYAEVGFRINYHDWLDNIAGYRQGAQIEMGNVMLRAQQQDVRVQQFDVLHIRSLGPRNLFSHPISWQVQGGFERGLLNADQWYIRAGGGVAYETGFGLGYVMALAELAINDQYKNTAMLSAGPELGWLKQHENMSSYVKTRWLYGIQNEEGLLQTDLGVSFTLGQNQQLRLQWQLQNREQTHGQNISLHYVLYR